MCTNIIGIRRMFSQHPVCQPKTGIVFGLLTTNKYTYVFIRKILYEKERKYGKVRTSQGKIIIKKNI